MKRAFSTEFACEYDLFEVFDSVFLVYNESGKLERANQALKRHFPHLKDFQYENMIEILRACFFVKEYELNGKRLVVAIEPSRFISNFMSGIFADLVHRLENPVAGALGFLGLARVAQKETGKLSEYTEKAELGIRKIEDVIKIIRPLAEQSISLFHKGNFSKYLSEIAGEISKDPRWKLRKILFKFSFRGKSLWWSFDPVGIRVAIESIVYFIEKNLKKGEGLELSLKKRDRFFSLLFTIKGNPTIRNILLLREFLPLELVVAMKIIRDHRGFIVLDRDRLDGKILELQFQDEAGSGYESEV